MTYSDGRYKPGQLWLNRDLDIVFMLLDYNGKMMRCITFWPGDDVPSEGHVDMLNMAESHIHLLAEP